MADPTTLGLIHEAQKRIQETQDDHDKRIRSVEQAIVLLTELVKEEHKPKAQTTAIVANLSTRELVFIGVAFTGFVTGKWDWLAGLFK